MEQSNYALKPGTRIKGKNHVYEIKKELGRGGFGITYIATKEMESDGCAHFLNVAIKEHFLSNYCSRNSRTQQLEISEASMPQVERSKKAFLKEAVRLENLGIDHHNIVHIWDVFEANNTAYYVMEYLGQTSLADYVKQRGTLSFKEAEEIMLPITAAVAFLHANRVAHYDIKPQNIMIATDDSGKIRPVLIDFGLAKHYDETGGATSTINIAGCTPGYAPTEQYRGVKTFSPSMDVYALAATYYFCLMGEAPAEAFDLDAAEAAARISPECGPRKAAAIRHALALKTADRTPDGSVFMTEMGWGGKTDMDASLHHNPAAPVSDPDATMALESYGNADDDKKLFSDPKRKWYVWMVIAILIGAFVLMGYLCYSAFQESSKNDEAARYEEAKAMPSTAKSYYSAYDLQAEGSDGNAYYFSREDWANLTDYERADFKPRGVVVVNPETADFVVSLQCSDLISWETAMANYQLPTKAQAEVMAQQHSQINDAIKAYGGDLPEYGNWYWTSTQSDEYMAWLVEMNNGDLADHGKANLYRARNVTAL